MAERESFVTDPLVADGYRNTDMAPFVYFDVAGAFGHATGEIIMIELAARTLSPTGQGNRISGEVFCTGRLRCSVNGARTLIDALSRAITLMEAEKAGREGVKN